MPARTREANDPPKRTPSFVCEVPLRVLKPFTRNVVIR